MLRLSIESLVYSMSVKNGEPFSQIYATASIPEGVIVRDSKFHGPVHIVISDKPIEPPFQNGSIYWDPSSGSFASAWLYAPAETIDRIADRASLLRQIELDLATLVANGGFWTNAEDSIAANGFSCTFSNGPAA